MRVSNDDRSEMGAGKTYRMGRIFGADCRTLVLPIDHGLTLGRVEGLEDPVGRLDDLLDLPCDGFLMTPGLTRLTTDRFARRDAPARLLTLDASSGSRARRRPAPGGPARWSRRPGSALTP
jgi:DhnA family fructose-bisphosphate aldolase class Ia